jgi:hypothetical protein
VLFFTLVPSFSLVSFVDFLLATLNIIKKMIRFVEIHDAIHFFFSMLCPKQTFAMTICMLHGEEFQIRSKDALQVLVGLYVLEGYT